MATPLAGRDLEHFVNLPRLLPSVVSANLLAAVGIVADPPPKAKPPGEEKKK